MKKSLMIIALSLTMVLANVNVVSASGNKNTYHVGDVVYNSGVQEKKNSVYQQLPDYNGKDIVFIENSSDLKSTSISLYKLENGKLVKTSDKISQFNNHYMLFWKADPVQIKGKECWKIGENLYINSPRISQLNVQKMHEVGQEVQNYGNYSAGNTKDKNVDTIRVNNSNGTNVPVMSLQKDRSFVLESNRVLSNNSVWITDKVRKYNGDVYCRIATNEWVNATRYVVK